MKKLLFILSFLLVNYSIAQTIGSKVSMFDPEGKTYTGVITGIQGDKYKVKYDGYDFEALLTSNQFKVLQSSPPVPNNRNNNQTNRNNADQFNQTTKVNRYGTRDPRTCTDKRSPLKDAITDALAEKYVICELEKFDGQYLYLVENVRVQVGVGRPYNPNMDINVPNMDVRFPIYPIRGSLTKYQCKDPKLDYIRVPGKTCARYEMPKATGFCYRTTFGEWRCHMTDFSNLNENYFPDEAPPK